MTSPIPLDRLDRPALVLGAGTLGRRIALMLASAGGTVRIYDPVAETRTAAVEYITAELPGVVAARQGARAGQVESSADLDSAVAKAWLVVEAVPERLELKKKIFGDLDRLAEPDAILASNSSSYASRLFLDEVSRPERVLNIHFYMPPDHTAADIMSCGRTDRAVLDFVLDVLPRFGVHPFEARRESTGFIYNRIWAAVKREALAVVAGGVATPRDVDEMCRMNGGMSAGPFRMMDQVGLDVVLDIENHYAAENPALPEGPRTLLREYVDQGRLGVKSGSGFYDYP
ncbi:3-hydroxyacyl-CoA dehydrogenase family protein [Nocardia pseudobrasiliensis]|uniref:3-hydroxybutyryl-CoA dehydrogenase n=1 Tax=Nocardia pseudobrasiliensis TaxID=45979 RepID=A0A370HXY0_9NOCA|nr:3-hydroxyacyl-CoA dehydrogenase family protein [Nocardia pseudobrasiliensis]RDI63367.1 3-hydroxybutyryl-CoA dehydrogenase [Nocardia pseudobrasiliensis]